jgi:hypothetical protein
VPSIPKVTDRFVPPQKQAGGLQLKEVAKVLEEGLHKAKRRKAGSSREMNAGVAAVIDIEFGPTARTYYQECVEEARGLVPEMRTQYHDVRHKHLMLYKDMLLQIRKEASFPQLQERSADLVLECARLDRPRTQSSDTISGLYRTAEAVSGRYNDLMASIGIKTGAIFHEAPQKGLVRITEKLALTAGAEKNWKPARITDIVRGALECKDFTTMISAVRMFRDLDADLVVTGETGGIREKICIVRSKDRFGAPTSGGWADIMVNFHFEDDKAKHICEVQLVHSQMYGLRKNMGAHASYGVFRGAKELMEMLGLDPEEGASDEDRALLGALMWAPPRSGASNVESPSVVALKVEAKVLRAEVNTLKVKVANFEAQEAAKAKEMAALEAKVEKLESMFKGLQKTPGLTSSQK